MIPKIIHYCWVGGKKKSKLIKKCIKSWQKYCPDYEIREWNDDNIDFSACKYAEETYKAKKFGLTSDYVRYFVLYNYGGIYLDVDVELIKPIDHLLQNKFLGCDYSASAQGYLNTGLIFGCEKGDKFCQDMLLEYSEARFNLPDGTKNYSAQPERTTRYFEKLGYKKENIKQEVAGYTIYPSEYFSPKNVDGTEINITENTYSIHHYMATWLPLSKRIKKKIIKLCGKNLTQKIVKIKQKIKQK